jgi:hypothetical protein
MPSLQATLDLMDVQEFTVDTLLEEMRDNILKQYLVAEDEGDQCSESCLFALLSAYFAIYQAHEQDGNDEMKTRTFITGDEAEKYAFDRYCKYLVARDNRIDQDRAEGSWTGFIDYRKPMWDKAELRRMVIAEAERYYIRTLAFHAEMSKYSD